MINPQKILVIRFSSIGDIVLASPLLRVLRKRFASARIDFVIKNEYSELVSDNPNINTVYKFDSIQGFNGLRQLKNSIQREQYDLIIDIHNNLRSRYLCAGLGAFDVVKINKRVFARTMLVKFKMNLYRHVVSVADRYIEPVKKFGIENDGEGLELYIPDTTISKISDGMSSLGLNRFQTIVGFCPSAKHATKTLAS